jgi:L-ornithine N5-oxygenase
MPSGGVHDLIGVGFGPSNIALAIALEEMGPDIDHVFLERRESTFWQDGMLLDGSDIQNNPLRDLVTPRNPQSRYTFVNYLKQTGRLFDYLNLGLQYPLRKDYAHYVMWVAEHFRERVAYRSEVEATELVPGPDGLGTVWRVTTSGGEERLARCLVLGPGRQPRIPAPFRPHLGKRVFHLNDYLRRIGRLDLERSSVAVVGASQSAVEILLDLMRRSEGVRVHAIHRSFSFRLKDTSPFSDHVYFPEFVDYFYKASFASRLQLEQQLRATNYSSVDADVLHQLYVRLYEERLDGRQRVELRNNTIVEHVEEAGDGVVLQTREIHSGETAALAVDAVVLATGFLNLGLGPDYEPYPPLLAGVTAALGLDESGVVAVERDYRVPVTIGERAPLLYLNGLCESTHGLGDAGSFSLVSMRAAEIAHSLLQRLCAGTAAMPKDPTAASA